MGKMKVSNAIIRRLPRYRRYLGYLQTKGIKKISSNELSEMIGYTASQIRQDLNTFGEFGQQGYGYEVEKLYKEINRILGLDREYKTVVVGCGNLGQAITNYTYYYKIGFNNSADLEEYVKRENIDIGIICVNRENAQKVADALVSGGVKGIWNFAPIDLVIPENVALESVHLSDSLHALSFMIKSMNEEARD